MYRERVEMVTAEAETKDGVSVWNRRTLVYLVSLLSTSGLKCLQGSLLTKQ